MPRGLRGLRSHESWGQVSQKSPWIWQHHAWLASRHSGVTARVLFPLSSPGSSCCRFWVNVFWHVFRLQCELACSMWGRVFKEEKAEKNVVPEWSKKEGEERKWGSEERESGKGKGQSAREGGAAGSWRGSGGEAVRRQSPPGRPVPSPLPPASLCQGREGCWPPREGAAGQPWVCSCHSRFSAPLLTVAQCWWFKIVYTYIFFYWISICGLRPVDTMIKISLWMLSFPSSQIQSSPADSPGGLRRGSGEPHKGPRDPLQPLPRTTLIGSQLWGLCSALSGSVHRESRLLTPQLAHLLLTVVSGFKRTGAAEIR